MKNYNTILFLGIFLFVSNITFAQSEKKTKGLFVDWDLSAMIADDDFMGHAALASGYRFNEKMAAGVEWRGASKFSCCNNFGMSGVGATYRFTEKWFLGKVSLGKVLKAHRYDDGFNEWRDFRGGYYYSLSLAYRLRGGFLMGLCYTGVPNNKFDYYIDENITGDFVFDRVVKTPFGTIGVMVGAAFPGRGRK